jgi:hypothetical protein
VGHTSRLTTTTRGVEYESLAGSPPFQREDDIALLWAHQFDPPSPLTEHRPISPPRSTA